MVKLELLVPAEMKVMPCFQKYVGGGLPTAVPLSTTSEPTWAITLCGVKVKEWAARLSQIDYEREMALVAEDAERAIVGVGRLAADPDGTVGEFALMVRTDHQAHGLGHALLSEVLAYARGRGLKSVWGDIERGNERMLVLAADLGFLTTAADDPVLLRATKTL